MDEAARAFLEELDESDLAELRSRGRSVDVDAGSAVFLEGDLSGRVVFVESGMLRVSVSCPSGVELLIGFRGPGGILGDQTAIDGLPHGQTVRAAAASRLLSVPREDFLDLLQRHPGIALALSKTHVRRLRESDALRMEQATVDVAGRVARRLADLRDISDGSALVISQQELADWVGASREAVTKALAKLRRRGLVETGRGSIVVTDQDGLRRHASVV